MKANDLRKKYLKFFESKKHKVIPSASLAPENDPTVLFTTAGMHPLVPFLMGEPHPLGKRLVDVQKCIRTQDIDHVGDETHTTFFEMLGNWSLGDYFKEDAIKFSYEFLTDKKWLGLDVNRLAVTCFGGDKRVPQIPKDEEAAKIWEKLGIPKERIAFLEGGVIESDLNWWGPAGEIGPCGPDTEMFYWKLKSKPPKKFDPKDENWVEIWNDVFMQYNKDKRLILVDGMHCLYDKNFVINKELLEFINSLNAHTILTVNGFREKGLDLIKNHDENRDTNWNAFSLEEKSIKKDNPGYFKTLLSNFGLVPEGVIYIDHDEKSIETAKKLGIDAKHYTGIDSIKNFIKDNLLAFIPLKQKNVDTGMGLERTAMVLQGLEDLYQTELFKPIIDKISKISKKIPNKENMQSFRIITDHMKASTFILGDERDIVPSNVEQGYILRRFIRRAIRHAKVLGIEEEFTPELAEIVIKMYKDDYPMLEKKKRIIIDELRKEEQRFRETLNKGLKEFQKIAVNLDQTGKNKVDGKTAFLLFQSFGFPIEIIMELAHENDLVVDTNEYKKEYEKHQEISRIGAEQKFKGGLADHGVRTTRLHTATHLLNEALRKLIDSKITQKGSNITAERLRFDFNFDRKLTDEELKRVEDEVNKVIKKALDVEKLEMTPEEAKKKGAQAEFGARYPPKVFVYKIGDYSFEICMGPHVKNTKEVGIFKILKEESIAAGIRRIKAVVE